MRGLHGSLGLAQLFPAAAITLQSSHLAPSRVHWGKADRLKGGSMPAGPLGLSVPPGGLCVH